MEAPGEWQQGCFFVEMDYRLGSNHRKPTSVLEAAAPTASQVANAVDDVAKPAEYRAQGQDCPVDGYQVGKADFV